MAEDRKPTRVTLHHPTLKGVTRTVAATDVEAWTVQGWRKTKPSH